MFCEEPHTALLEIGFTCFKRICCCGSCGPPLSMGNTCHHHSLCADGEMEEAGTAAHFSGRNTHFMNQALAEDGDLRSSQLAPSDGSTLRVSWGVCDRSLVWSSCCPGVDLLSYQWGLEGGGEGPALAPQSCLGWRVCRMDLGVERAQRNAGGCPCWWGGCCSSKLGPIGRETIRMN